MYLNLARSCEFSLREKDYYQHYQRCVNEVILIAADAPFCLKNQGKLAQLG